MRQKTCRNCKEKFTPRFSSLEKNCWKTECKTQEATAYYLKQKKKKEQEEKQRLQKQKEDIMSNQAWRTKVQVVFNQFIRTRDAGKPCISCGVKLEKKHDAGHYFSVGNYPALRYNEDNCHAQCVECNHHKGSNHHEYTIGIINRIGMERVERLREKRHETRKYTIPELKELNELYKEKIKNLLKKNT